MTIPQFTDLRTLAAELQGRGEFRRLRSAIERVVRVQSCVSDLAQATTCCDALDDLLASARRKGTLTRSATEASLLQTAVSLYERATSAAGKRGERGSVSIANHLSGEQLEDHRALVHLRQRALAHVYAGEAIEGQVWHRDVLFAIKTEQAWKPAAASNRIQFDGTTFARLKRQVPLAATILTRRFHEHLNQLTTLLNQNPVPSSLYEKHRFDPIGVFGSERAVKAVLGGQIRGRTSFVGP
jgi:hypothetical protein